MSLDPIIMKGIYLLRSKAKDSGQQLKELLDDLIEKSKYNEETASAKEYDPIDNIEKLKRDIIDLGSSNIFQPKKLKAFDPLVVDRSRDGKGFHTSNESLVINDFVVESSIMDNSLNNDLFEKEGFDYNTSISCIICKKSSITPQNKIIECLDCHSLYHQDCHNPKVLEDVNDPRFVWYCHICTSKEKDISSLIKSPTYPGKEQKPPTPTPKIINKTKRPETLTVFPFKRPEQKSPLHFTPTDSNSSGESFGFKMPERLLATTNKLERNKNLKHPFKTLSVDKVSGNDNFANKLSNPLRKNVHKKTSLQSPAPKLTGLAGLAANLLRQTSPNTSTSINPNPGNILTAKSPQPFKSSAITNANYFTPSNISFDKDDLILGNPLRPKSNSHSTVSVMGKNPILSPPTSSTSSSNKFSAFNRKASLNIADVKSSKTLQGTPNPVGREGSSSASTSFNPPTMKDYEKRLQKMKKRKIP